MANWTEIRTDLAPPGDDGKRQLAAPWLLALRGIEDCDHLRLEAEGEWELVPGLGISCGPDGRGDIPLAAEALLLPSCAPGALIGKIGGSSAAVDKIAEGADPKAGAPLVFAIGKTCMVPFKDLLRGPLFIGVNIRPRPLTIARLDLKIFGATLG